MAAIFSRPQCVNLSTFMFQTTIMFNIIYYKTASMDDYIYPDSANVVAWFITLFPFTILLGYFLYEFCKGGGLEVNSNSNTKLFITNNVVAWFITLFPFSILLCYLL